MGRPAARTIGTAAAGIAALVLVSAPATGALRGEETFSLAGRDAAATLLNVYYAGGSWRDCNAPDCGTGNSDWGDDSLTYALALRYRVTHAGKLLGPLQSLAAGAPSYGAPCAGVSGCNSWSDVPEWDSIALSDEYMATGNPIALRKAEAAFALVEQSGAYALGACPRIRYQQPGGGENQLKTLETDSNSVKAALLLYEETHRQSYLDAARSHYGAIRSYFLDPKVPLYSVYVFDNGTTCTQLPHRFFASVNGNMIWAGAELFRLTGVLTYLDEALATAQAVDRDLSDGRGIFVDLQAENDVVEPLVEAMYVLAIRGHRFARDWILKNAAAALEARGADGSFSRFFDGPPPSTTVTAWQTNGGLALEIAAGALAPRTSVPTGPSWASAAIQPDDISVLPATITVHGAGIALLGTLGEQCCEAGHARVFIDGHETFDRTGIWQNKSSSGRSISNTVLFAWRWAKAGTHTIGFQPGETNGKEGGPFLHLVGYELAASP
jgi:hypothetical protein